jgi:hypothetical protein
MFVTIIVTEVDKFTATKAIIGLVSKLIVGTIAKFNIATNITKFNIAIMTNITTKVDTIIIIMIAAIIGSNTIIKPNMLAKY